ncbi:MAG: ferrochelatase [Hyphomicrobiaceae bacterium]
MNEMPLSPEFLPDPEAAPVDHPKIARGRIGVLLVNLGTPDGTDYWPMRRYLKEFLSDRRVIETPRAIWWPLLNGIILTTRPKKSGAAYASIWNKERNESPLRTITRSQSALLSEALADLGPSVMVDWGMRYGQPSIASRLDRLMEAGCERILLFPLYPQYAAATTATVNDKAFEWMGQQRWQPAMRTVPPYPDDPAYIDALAGSIEAHLETLDWEPEVILASYHGVPKSYLTKGDPYHCQCHKTTRLLKARMGAAGDPIRTTFQSRFGPEEWLQPYTDETVEALAQEGVKRIAVFNPGFVADCLETLEEIAGEAKEIFHEHGGELFSHIPCLNDSERGMAVIETIVRRELMGWI